jgi:hypothetical protein
MERLRLPTFPPLGQEELPLAEIAVGARWREVPDRMMSAPSKRHDVVDVE